jgi:hypothetical protein
MKPHGSILRFTKRRNDELIKAYRYQLGIAKHIKVYDIGAALVNMPASRFWVSEDRAAIVIGAMMSGRGLPKNMRPTKREMFTAIYEHVVQLQQKYPDMSIRDLTAKAVNCPAPKFYMLPRSALDVIYKIKNGYYDEIFNKQRQEYQSYL